MLSFKVNELVTSLCKKELVIKLKEIFDYFVNKQDYDIFCEIIENYILDDYSRATNETVKIICEDDEEVEITLFQFLINLYFLEFNFMYKIPITRDWMQDIDVNFLKDYHKNLEKICQEKIYPIIEKKKINSEEDLKIQKEILEKNQDVTSEIAELCGFETIFVKNALCMEAFKHGKPLKSSMFHKSLWDYPNDCSIAVFKKDDLFDEEVSFLGLINKDAAGKVSYGFVIG